MKTAHSNIKNAIVNPVLEIDLFRNITNDKKISARNFVSWGHNQ